MAAALLHKSTDVLCKIVLIIVDKVATYSLIYSIHKLTNLLLKTHIYLEATNSKVLFWWIKKVIQI